MSKAQNRITKELRKFREDPPPFIKSVHVNESNLHEFHFLIDGPKDTPFEGGEYVLFMSIPQEYPFSAPRFKMITPNGRYTSNHWICISGVSNHHPGDWSPSQNFGSTLVSIISFMIDDKVNGHVGSEVTTPDQKRILAGESKAYNSKNKYDKLFTDVLLK